MNLYKFTFAYYDDKRCDIFYVSSDSEDNALDILRKEHHNLIFVNPYKVDHICINENISKVVDNIYHAKL